MNKISTLFNDRSAYTSNLLITGWSILWGGAFLFDISDARQTRLYANFGFFNQEPQLFGAMLLITVGVMIIGLCIKKPSFVYYGSQILALVWLYAGFVYLFAGSLFLAFTVGFIWSLMYGYGGYIFKRRVEEDASIHVYEV